MVDMKRNIVLLSFILFFSVIASAFDFTPLYYQGQNGKEFRISRWNIQITGMSKYIEFTDYNDSNFHYEDTYTVQNMYLYEKEDGRYMYFQRYKSKGNPNVPSSFKYTPQNIWAKVAIDWSVYIDSNGVSHKLYKK